MFNFKSVYIFSEKKSYVHLWIESRINFKVHRGMPLSATGSWLYFWNCSNGCSGYAKRSVADSCGARNLQWLNSALLSDCFSLDGWDLAQLGTDIQSPIQPIERWPPLGYKSQLLLRRTVKAIPRAISEASKILCVRREKIDMNWWRQLQNTFLAVEHTQQASILPFSALEKSRASIGSTWFSLWGQGR